MKSVDHNLVSGGTAAISEDFAASGQTATGPIAVRLLLAKAAGQQRALIPDVQGPPENT